MLETQQQRTTAKNGYVDVRVRIILMIVSVKVMLGKILGFEDVKAFEAMGDKNSLRHTLLDSISKLLVKKYITYSKTSEIVDDKKILKHKKIFIVLK